MQNVESVRGLSSSCLTCLSPPICKFSGSPPSILSIFKQVYHDTFSFNKHIKRTKPYYDLSGGVFSRRFPFDLKATPLHAISRVSNHLILKRKQIRKESMHWSTSSGTRGLFLESPEMFSGPKSHLSNCNPLVFKS